MADFWFLGKTKEGKNMEFNSLFETQSIKKFPLNCSFSRDFSATKQEDPKDNQHPADRRSNKAKVI